MGTIGRTTRRGLLFAGGAAVASASSAKVSSALAAAGYTVYDDERTQDVVFVGSGSGENLRFQRIDGSEIELVDPHPAGDIWEPGHEAIIIENLIDGEWQLTDVQRLYREIVPQDVKGRTGNNILGEVDDVVIEADTEPTAGNGFQKSPLTDIEAGSVVGGMGYRNGDGEYIIAALLASRNP